MHIVIIGNGISGVTAARHIRKGNDTVKITIISSETDYFYSRTALMYIYMGHMTFENTQPYEPHFWKKNRIELKKAFVERIDYNIKTLYFTEKETPLRYDYLILAVGSKPNKFGWKGQDLLGVQGMYSYQDLEKIELYSKKATRAVIVGGGLIGIEMAEMLLSRGIKVTFLIRENLFWNNVLPQQEARLITKHIEEHHIDLRKNTELDEIIADENGVVSKIRTKDGEIIECQLVGLTAGVSPNIDFLRGGDLKVDKGVLVNEFLDTNIPHVYAIGDCAQFINPVKGRRNLEQVWYTGKIMGENIAASINGLKTRYAPGNWFNSAKFLDIEYQTYGWVFSKLRTGEAEFYWEHKNGKMCMHFVFNQATRQFIGINTFGIRLRHHAFDTWLNEKKSIDYIIEHLKDANFDPELYIPHEEEIVAQFNKETGANIILKPKSWKRILSWGK